MLPETTARVKSIRERTEAARAKLEAAKAKFGDNNDTHLLEEIKRATYWLNDVEDVWIPMLKDRVPPRTRPEESLIIANTEVHLSVMTIPLIDKISDWANLYGPKFQSIG